MGRKQRHCVLFVDLLPLSPCHSLQLPPLCCSPHSLTNMRNQPPSVKNQKRIMNTVSLMYRLSYTQESLHGLLITCK